jgi:hypothetical protein
VNWLPTGYASKDRRYVIHVGRAVTGKIRAVNVVIAKNDCDVTRCESILQAQKIVPAPWLTCAAQCCDAVLYYHVGAQENSDDSAWEASVFDRASQGDAITFTMSGFADMESAKRFCVRARNLISDCRYGDESEW